VRIVLDTNVFVSGVLSEGVPAQILTAWKSGQLKVVTSPAIIKEIQYISNKFAYQKNVGFDEYLELLLDNAEICQPVWTEGSTSISRDPDDDKFIVCALAAGVEILVSGDKDLTSISGYKGIKVLTPREFFEQFLS